MAFRLTRLISIAMFGFYLHQIGLEYTSSYFLVSMASVVVISIISHVGGWVERVEYETIAIKQLATISTEKLVQYSQSLEQSAKDSKNPVHNKDYSI